MFQRPTLPYKSISAIVFIFTFIRVISYFQYYNLVTDLYKKLASTGEGKKRVKNLLVFLFRGLAEPRMSALMLIFQ